MSSLDTSNVFAALSKKKKKSTKNIRNEEEEDCGIGASSATNRTSGGGGGGGGGGDSETRQGSAESGGAGDAKRGAVDTDLWNTPTLTVSSWADCEDDDLSALGPLPSWADVRDDDDDDDVSLSACLFLPIRTPPTPHRRSQSGWLICMQMRALPMPRNEDRSAFRSAYHVYFYALPFSRDAADTDTAARMCGS